MQEFSFFIPNPEKWLYEPNHAAKLEKALQWMQKNQPVANFKKLLKEFESGKVSSNCV